MGYNADMLSPPTKVATLDEWQQFKIITISVANCWVELPTRFKRFLSMYVQFRPFIQIDIGEHWPLSVNNIVMMVLQYMVHTYLYLVALVVFYEI